MNPPKISQGDILSNNDIVEYFKCGNAGGIRPGYKTNSLILVSDHTKSLYDDAWYGNVMHYTGMGRKGNQDKFYLYNENLFYSKENNVNVHLFEVYKRNNYVYQGQVELSGEPFQENQPDEDNRMRKAWMFPVSLISGAPLHFDESVVEKVYVKRLRIAKKLPKEKLLDNVTNKEKKAPSKRKVVSESYLRDPNIVIYALERADGHCQLCEEPAPFDRKNGEPFLEVHHIQYLSKGGTDTIDNVVALCPNCHRKMHALEDKKDVRKLMKITKSRPLISSN